uniref:Putative capsid protein n=1 Tax=viral metagenome TaxID=1070528 RepID=A0A6M3ILR4_9ZZZZ
MPVVRNQFTKGMVKDMYAYGVTAYEQLPSVHDKVFEVIGSTTAYEQETQVLDAGELVEKPEHEPIVYENAMEGYTIYGKNRTYGKGIEFSMELVEDMPPEKIANIVRYYAALWAKRLVQKKEEFAAGFFNYGGYTAGHDTFNAKITGVTPSDAPTALCYDGKPFFNLSGNNRPLYPGGTASYYNALALDLNTTNLETAYTLFTSTNNVDSRGKKIMQQPDALIIPSGLKFTAMKLLNSTNVVGSANNDVNTVQNIVPNLIEWQYLTDTDAWFLAKLKQGLKFHNRKPLTYDFWQDEDTGGYKAKVIARFGAYVYDWRSWVGSNLSTS